MSGLSQGLERGSQGEPKVLKSLVEGEHGLKSLVKALRDASKSHPTSATPAPRTRIIDSDGAVIEKTVEKPVLQEIGDLDFSTSRSQTIKDVDPATWDELQTNHGESMSHRLEYSVDLKAVTVTCVSGVHECYKVICEPFLRVPAASPFLDFETNRDIDIPSPTGGHSIRVPDSALVNKANSTDPACPFILECSWAQSFREVEVKALLRLTLAHVEAVLCIDIQERRTQEPYLSASNLDKEYKLANPAEFRSHRGTRLSSVWKKIVFSCCAPIVLVVRAQVASEPARAHPGLAHNRDVINEVLGKEIVRWHP
ncbi:hypothetical protein DFH09DRAFT_1108423 [Mycena vulgaris]|nr:hypothetical protein DFH09DRAFT_1108423 [Mycena vulgaris]